jgi:NADH:ubiquinone reductase (H+-translocating)
VHDNDRRSNDRRRVLLVGGGYVGLYAARRLMRRLDRREWVVTVVDPRSYMTYQPFLPEAAAGSVSPRHTVVPLRPVLKHAEVIAGRVTMIEHVHRRVRIEPIEGESYGLDYEHIVVCAGAVPRLLPIPGLAEHGMGFKQIEEAIALRNYVIERLELAESTYDPVIRRRALTFVFVGGGYAGIEAIAELEDMARYATRYYDHIEVTDLNFVLIEASDRILPEVGPELGEYALIQLLERRIDVRLRTFLQSYEDRHVVLSDGDAFHADTLVWTAGVKANPVIATSDLPFDDRGRLSCDPTLRVIGHEGAWGAGDCAAVPDLTNPGEFTSPSAQHAVRQAPVLADNILRVIRGHEPRAYRHKHAGSVASLGLHKGVAHVYGIKLRGWPAWFMHRTYHVSRVPTLQRKASIVAEWTLQLFFPRDVVGLGALHAPRAEFGRVAQP